jgi:hypothetical protein
MLLRRALPLLIFLVALALSPGAYARGGNYVFDGGTPAEQGQVKAALDASTFDFSVVPTAVTIHIGRGLSSSAGPGQIWLDADLLDAGRFSWGVVQHEYGHQVDFSVLTDAGRAQLQPLLGGSAWRSGAAHGELASERFADLISWAYWASPDNVLRPTGKADEGGEASPAAFRAALAQLLASPIRVMADTKERGSSRT